jgi:hypothetical protein
VNLVIGIVFIVSDFVVTVFPREIAKLVGVWLRTGPSSSRLSTTRELKHGIASKFRKTAVSPNISENNSSPLPPTRVVPMESATVKPQVEAGCMDHNYDIVERGTCQRDGEDQGFVHGPPIREMESFREMESSTVKPQVETGCMDHNHDIVDQGFIRGRDTEWDANLKQNLDRSAVALPVEETIPMKRIFISSKTRKLTSILSSHGQSVREKDDTFL